MRKNNIHNLKIPGSQNTAFSALSTMAFEIVLNFFRKTNLF